MVEVNDKSRGTYNVNSEIKFKTSTLRSILCNYSDAYILASAAVTVPNPAVAAAAAAAANNRKIIIIKICAPFTNCISKMNK